MRDMAHITDYDLLYQVNNLTQLVQVTQSCETMQWYKYNTEYHQIEWSRLELNQSPRAMPRRGRRKEPGTPAEPPRGSEAEVVRKTEDSQWKVIILAGKYY